MSYYRQYMVTCAGCNRMGLLLNERGTCARCDAKIAPPIAEKVYVSGWRPDVVMIGSAIIGGVSGLAGAAAMILIHARWTQ